MAAGLTLRETLCTGRDARRCRAASSQAVSAAEGPAEERLIRGDGASSRAFLMDAIDDQRLRARAPWLRGQTDLGSLHPHQLVVRKVTQEKVQSPVGGCPTSMTATSSNSSPPHDVAFALPRTSRFRRRQTFGSRCKGLPFRKRPRLFDPPSSARPAASGHPAGRATGDGGARCRRRRGRSETPALKNRAATAGKPSRVHPWLVSAPPGPWGNHRNGPAKRGQLATVSEHRDQLAG